MSLLRQLREMKQSLCTNQSAISCISTGIQRWPKHPTKCKFQHICATPFAIANIGGTKRQISPFERWKWSPEKGMRLPFWASPLKNHCRNSRRSRTSAVNELIASRFSQAINRELSEKGMEHHLCSHRYQKSDQNCRERKTHPNHISTLLTL